MRSARGRTALLLVTLAALAIVLGTASTGLSSPLFGLSVTLPHPAPPAPPPTPISGKLLVNVSLYGAGGGASRVAGATVSIGSGVIGSPPQLLTTNSSGEAETSLYPGNYTLEVYNTEFSTFADIPLLASNTTVATVSVNKSETQPILSDLSDEDGSGFVGPWQQISIAVNSSSAMLVLSSSVLFLDAVYSPTVTTNELPVTVAANGVNLPTVTNETRAVVISEPTNASAPGLLWFVVQPKHFISVTGLSDLTIASYTASMKVTIVGH
ncbi:MAG: hypothetical protein OK449_08160 [Thaumarchaeota archaeon]|nr:hypothetical protein [Nitrososphaerota archaeon]